MAQHESVVCAAFGECVGPQLHELLRAECFAEQVASEAYECALIAHRALDAIETQYANSQHLHRSHAAVVEDDDDTVRATVSVPCIDMAQIDGLLDRLRSSAVATCFAALDQAQLQEFDLVTQRLRGAQGKLASIRLHTDVL